MDQASQTSKDKKRTNDNVLALSWKIATEPKLYWELAPNPYSPAAQQIISERFPDAKARDITRAVILAEPEGSYDRNFRLLGTAEQAEELRRQKDVYTEINKRLVQYCRKHIKEFTHLSREFIYNSLSMVVFDTVDPKVIEQRYSKNQRLDLRLAIVNFIEDIPRLSSHRFQGQQLLKSSLIALCLILLFYITQTQILSNTENQDSKKQIPTIEKQYESQKFPVRLKIPTINVDASIEYVGLTSDGEMGVPRNTFNVGWFKLGTRPGEKGSSVIAGHFDGEDGKAGVFTNLNKLKEGDKLYIEAGNGTLIAFVVRRISTYEPGYAEEVFSPNDIAHLNLITCDGVWDGDKKSYSKRLVVFADITD